MYLIDQTYFYGRYSIPNIQEMQSDAQKRINDIIDEKVREVLMGALGFEQFAGFDNQVVNGELLINADQKWKDLVEGVTYDGKKWNGLTYALGGAKKSFLVPYVFYHYLSEDQPNYTGIGMAIQRGKNQEIVSKVPTLSEAWNDFLEGYQGWKTGVLPRVQTHYGATFVDFLGHNYQDRNIVTLIRYLADHSDVYESTPKIHYPRDNRYGL